MPGRAASHDRSGHALAPDLVEKLSAVRRVKNPVFEHIMIGQERLVRNLRGQTERFSTYDEPGFSQSD